MQPSNHAVSEDLSRLSHLIGLIYEGATDPSRWTKEILPSLADYFDVPDCLLFTPMHGPKDGGYCFLYGRSQEFQDRYTSKYQAEDPITIAALAKNQVVEGNVFLVEDLVPRQQWLESKLYTECYSSHPNMAQGMTSVVFGMDTADSMLCVFTLCRSLQHPDFNQEDVCRLRLILPHISRSLGVMERLRSAELSVASSLAALDQLSSGVLLLDTSGTVRFVNRAAHKILEEGDGLGLRKLGKSAGLGDLGAASIAGSQAINRAISETLRRDPFTTPHFSKRVVVPRTSGLASFSLQFSALGDHHEFGGSGGAFAAIVFIADGLTKLDVDAATLQDVYGLTPAETSVAITLLEFGSAKKVALVLNLSPHTVRSNIKSIYEKLGVATRTRFVKLMLGLTRNQS